MKTKTIGVVVGRFQTPSLHQGHHHLIDYMYSRHNLRLVVLGDTPTRGTKRNPLDTTTRRTLFKLWGDSLHVRTLSDQESDAAWSLSLDKLICDTFPLAQRGAKVVLYGGRDSFISKYSGRFDTQVVKSTHVASSTQLRTEVGRTTPSDTWTEAALEGFRKGVIYASENAFPQVLPTVDIAVTSRANPDGTGPLRLLLGWKKGEDKLRFPGGFVDPTDTNLELAGKRELMEEAPGIAVEGPLNYVGSTLVQDWRYLGPERVMTTFFHGEYTFGSTTGGDDLEGLTWVPFDKKTRNRIRTSHQPLYDMLLTYLKENNYGLAK